MVVPPKDRRLHTCAREFQRLLNPMMGLELQILMSTARSPMSKGFIPITQPRIEPLAPPPTMMNIVGMSTEQLNGPPTKEQIILWQETNGHTNAWLARHLGMDAEDVRLCFEVGFHDDDLQTIAELMTHPREILGQ
jgi:hypothetical protein